MSSNIQVVIEKQRVVYGSLARPLLAQIADLHGITVRDFAEIFEISKSYSGEILNHQKMPNLELALKISRYFECSVEELFGWRVDDDGMRRPLLIELNGTGKLIRLKPRDPECASIGLTVAVAEEVRQLREKRKAERDGASNVHGVLQGGAAGEQESVCGAGEVRGEGAGGSGGHE